MKKPDIPFLGERDPDTGYHLEDDAPTECPNGEPLPCDCRDFWIVRANYGTFHDLCAVRCDAHSETPISDCSLHSDSLRDVLLYACGRQYNRGSAAEYWEIGNPSGSWAETAPPRLPVSEYSTFWSDNHPHEGGCCCDYCDCRR
jgi:hypothetical protein